MTKHSYRVGSTIKYTAFGGERREVLVEEKDSDIKNGRPGFAGSDQNGEPVWGYDDQITAVIKR